jgi:hypothetical protein
VLLNRDTAEGIANGSITLVLRRWDVPRAKAGGTAQADLDRRPAKHTYAIEVSFLAPDERPELAADDRLSDSDAAAISARLPWAPEYMELIAANEAVRAPDLAARLGMETAPFKQRVRRLKGLGLTISLDVGYRVSPRGHAYLVRAAAD